MGQDPYTSTANRNVDYLIFVLIETPLGIPTTGTAPTLQVVVEADPVDPVFLAPHRPLGFTNNLGDFTKLAALPAPASFEGVCVLPCQSGVASEAMGALQSVQWKNKHHTLDHLPPRVEDFRGLLSRPTVKAILDVGTAYSVGDVLAQWEVSPINDILTNNVANGVKTIEGSTFLHSFSRLFLQWTGSIVYTAEWTGPAVSAGRLILGYQPMLFASLRLEPMDQQYQQGTFSQLSLKGLI